jgi:hypothetical protein
VGKRESNRSLGRPRHRREDNIKMYFQEMGRGRLEWICLAFVRMVMNLHVP